MVFGNECKPFFFSFGLREGTHQSGKTCDSTMEDYRTGRMSRAFCTCVSVNLFVVWRLFHLASRGLDLQGHGVLNIIRVHGPESRPAPTDLPLPFQSLLVSPLRHVTASYPLAAHRWSVVALSETHFPRFRGLRRVCPAYPGISTFSSTGTSTWKPSGSLMKANTRAVLGTLSRLSATKSRWPFTVSLRRRWRKTTGLLGGVIIQHVALHEGFLCVRLHKK